MPGEQFLFELRQLHLQRADLICEAGHHALCERRDLRRLARDKPASQVQRMMQAARHLDSELGQQTTHHVHQLRALLDQQVARAVQRQRRLLLSRLHRYEPHARTRYRLADRLSVIRIGLAALHIRLHVGRRHQAHIMPELRQLPCPMMRRAARLHADAARRQLRKER